MYCSVLYNCLLHASGIKTWLFEEDLDIGDGSQSVKGLRHRGGGRWGGGDISAGGLKSSRQVVQVREASENLQNRRRTWGGGCYKIIGQSCADGPENNVKYLFFGETGGHKGG